MNIYVFSIVVFSIVAVIGITAYRNAIAENTKAKKTTGRDKTIKPTTKTGVKTSDKWVTDLIPIKSYDPIKDVYVTDSGIMDLMMINSKDLSSANEDEIEYDCLKFAKLYKVYGSDLKLIALNFPCNTLKQQEYFRHKIETAKNDVFRAWCGKKLSELEYLEKTTTREFYLMMFSKDVETHEKNKTLIRSILTTGRDGLIKDISAEKKHKILYKLFNKTSMVL